MRMLWPWTSLMWGFGPALPLSRGAALLRRLERVFRPVLQLRPARPFEQELERRVAHGPEQRDRAGDAAGGDQQGDRAQVGHDPGLEQHGARGRHAEEERQIDDNRIL